MLAMQAMEPAARGSLGVARTNSPASLFDRLSGSSARDARLQCTGRSLRWRRLRSWSRGCARCPSPARVFASCPCWTGRGWGQATFRDLRGDGGDGAAASRQHGRSRLSLLGRCPMTLPCQRGTCPPRPPQRRGSSWGPAADAQKRNPMPRSFIAGAARSKLGGRTTGAVPRLPPRYVLLYWGELPHETKP